MINEKQELGHKKRKESQLLKMLHLRVELLVVAVQAMDVTLSHGARTAHLKADSAVVNAFVKLLKTGDTNILQRVLDTGDKVRDELGDRATVEDGTGDALSNEDAVLLGEVAGGSSVARLAVLAVAASLLILHGGNTAHTTVGFDELAFVADKVLTGRLGGTGEETAHHDGSGAHSETLDNVTNILDTPVSDTWDAKASRKLGDAANGESLGTADSHDLLCNTSTAAAHTNSQAINTSSDQSRGLVPSHDISANDINFRVRLLNVFDHLDLIHTVALTAVEDDNIKTSFDEELQSVLVLLAGANSSSTDQLLRGGQLRSKRVVKVLHQITAREKRDKVAVLIDDGQLSFLGATKDLVSLGQGGASRCGDEVGGHDGSDRVVEVVVELDVSSADNTNKL